MTTRHSESWFVFVRRFNVVLALAVAFIRVLLKMAVYEAEQEGGEVDQGFIDPLEQAPLEDREAPPVFEFKAGDRSDYAAVLLI